LVVEPLNHTLEESISEFGLSDIYVSGKLASMWSEIVGDQIAAKTVPLSIKSRVLLVRTTSPSWSYQLSFLKPTIIAKLRGAGFEVDGLRFVVQENKDVIREATPAEIKEPDISPPDFSKIPQNIDDQKLRLAIASYLGASKGRAK
jgi:hypothetical protein